jgi:tetratricopeptide (TPR) repeat protein
MKKVLLFIGILLCGSWGWSQQEYIGPLRGYTIDGPIIQANGIQRFFIESDNLMREGKNEEAIIILTDAISMYPNYAESYIKRAQQLSKIGRMQEARRDMQTAYRLSPFITEFLQSRNEPEKLQWIAFLETDYLAYANQHPSDELKNLVESSLEKKKTGDLIGAIVDLEMAFMIEGDREVKLHSLMGNLLLLTENYEQAIRSYDQAIRLAPNTAYLYFNRGVTRLFTYERSKACEDLERSEELGYEIPFDKLSFFCYY